MLRAESSTLSSIKSYHLRQKTGERDSRSYGKDEVYQITGPDQKRPANWLNALLNDSFKVALVGSLVSYWEKDEVLPLLGSKELFVNSGDKCFAFKSINKAMIKSEVEDLDSTNEEADSRMIFHAKTISPPANIAIRTVDTDILIIALGSMHLFDPNIKLWMETGLYSKNTLRYININEIYQSIGSKVSKALPALHAFTGCDYTSSFSRKGKIRPLKMLEKNVKLQDTFAGLGCREVVSEDTATEIEGFVCTLYGLKRMKSVDEAIFELFQKKYKTSEEQTISFKNKLDIG